REWFHGLFPNVRPMAPACFSGSTPARGTTRGMADADGGAGHAVASSSGGGGAEDGRGSATGGSGRIEAGDGGGGRGRRCRRREPGQRRRDGGDGVRG